MKERLLKYLQYGNQYYGIEHTAVGDNDKFYVLGLKKSKNEVDVSYRGEIDDIEEISQIIPKNTSVCLIVNNDLVLTKRIETKSGEDKIILNEAFPNLRLEDFYYEILREEHYTFISICRQVDIDQIIKTYTGLNVSIIDISLGTLAIKNVLEYINNTDIITTSNASVQIVDKAFHSIEKMQISTINKYEVNGINISNTELLSFSGAISIILNLDNFSTNLKSVRIPLFKDFQQKRFFSQFLKTGLISLFGILLLNFFIFNNYFNQISELQETSQFMSSSKEKVTTLNVKVIKSKKMVEDIQKSNSSKSTFYLNQIISDIPASIILEDYEYQPLLKRINKDKPIKTKINAIEFSGVSTDSKVLSDWMDNLENIEWVNSVEVVNYENTSKNKSRFSTLIYIKNDI